MRESAAVKARRYLIEGRLTLLELSAGGPVVAECKGDSGEIYKLGYKGRRRWCTCPARAVTCSHQRALMLVAPRPWRPANDLLDTHGREPIQPWEQMVPPTPYRRDA
jgi:uncharacterized Zn finger protein